MRTERLKSGASDPKELAKSWAHRDFRPTTSLWSGESFFLRSLRSFAAIRNFLARRAQEPTCARALPTHYGLAVMSFSTLTWPCKPRSVSCEDDPTQTL